MAFSLRNIPLTQQLARSLDAMESSARFSKSPRGTVRGTIVEVKDPQNRGRVKVVFDAMNGKDIPQATGTGEGIDGERISSGFEKSHWIDTSPAFKGHQPEGLIGKRVNISVSNGEYQYAILQDVMYDPDILTEQAAKKLEIPNNSPMTRLPFYRSGSLPPPCKENRGCTVVEEDGPLDSDWLCVCLKRNGKYLWVRHVDLSHGHAGQNDGLQPPDSGGDGEPPVAEQTIWDYAFPTTAGEMQKITGYGTGPRPNPFGGRAGYQGPAT